jgi:hypothetical protein
MKLLEDISERDIVSVDIPTSVPIIYDVDEENRATRCSIKRTDSSQRAGVVMELMANKAD